ncbi:MAG TPA: hypothetical protein VF629_14130 [Hymenobacter sp.]|uniref:hypothetical protein n=1 Tax=Hymenobacter sp. TaxID=1898978 RepID=UPI002EDA2AED
MPKNRVTFNDFESLDGWAPVPVTDEKAHSGRYSIKVDKAAEFSLGYTNFLGKASPTRISKLTVSGWALRTGGESRAVIVVQVINPANPDEKVYWQSMDMYQQIKTYNTWTRISKEFTLPATIQPTYQLRVYMWLAGSNQPTFLDDVEITKS